jgi:hypothetical protein
MGPFFLFHPRIASSSPSNQLYSPLIFYIWGGGGGDGRDAVRHVVIPLYLYSSASASLTLLQWMKEASKWVQDQLTILGFLNEIW